MKDLWQNKTKRYIVIFITVSLLSGWIGVLLDRFLPEQPEGDSLGMLVWLVLPLICALILNAKSKDWFGFGHKLNLKNNVIWYVFALLIFPVMLVLFGLIALMFGALEVGAVNISILNLIIGSLIFLLVKNIFEDFAWRGFLTAKLIKTKVNDLWIYLITGAIWALWHAAYYMVFLPEDLISGSRIGFVGLSLIIIPIWGVMFTEMYRITGSVWPVVLMHIMEDAVPTMLIHVEHTIVFKGAAELWLNPLQGIIPIGVYLLIGLWLRSKRLKLNKPCSI